jgi:hypothetical protein
MITNCGLPAVPMQAGNCGEKGGSVVAATIEGDSIRKLDRNVFETTLRTSLK